MDDQQYLSEAVTLAQESVENGGGPFGALIVRDGEIIGRGCNCVTGDHDPTAHAEINVIRQASRKLGTKDLSGCILITTHEPCPMCAAAIVWSGIKKIVFGFSIEDALKQGRRRIGIPCREIFSRAG
ncbi:MAG: nucleoside deaminase, partial [Gammaproteobacteria bacterium]|nr:nucleoside deaminase [Gammaproteobacteria bacterium]